MSPVLVVEHTGQPVAITQGPQGPPGLVRVGTVCFTLDDNWINQIQLTDYAATINVHLTMMAVKHQPFGTPFGYDVGHPTCWDLTDALKMRLQGHEIANHTKTHFNMTQVALADQGAEWDDVTTDLIAAGLPAPTTCGWPLGVSDYAANQIAFPRFRFARRTGSPFQVPWRLQGSIFNFGSARVLADSVNPAAPGDSRVKDVRKLIELASRSPIIVICHWHDEGYGGVEASIADVKSLMAYAVSLGVPCRTMSEALWGPQMLLNPSFDEGTGTDLMDAWQLHQETGTASTSVVAKTPKVGVPGTKVLKCSVASSSDLAYRGQRCRAPDIGRGMMLSGQLWLDAAGAVATYATDMFTRTTASGWGTADLGGSWSVITGTASQHATDGNVATHQAHRGSEPHAP